MIGGLIVLLLVEVKAFLLSGVSVEFGMGFRFVGIILPFVVRGLGRSSVIYHVG